MAFSPDPVSGLSLGRIAIGVAALVDPDRTARLFGLDPDANPQMPYFSRMFGAREVALGAVTLASKGAARRNLTMVGIAVDASDAATGALGLKGKQFPTMAGGMLVGAALSAVGSGVVALVRGRRQ